MTCKQLWIRAGTSKQRKYIPVHDIRQTLGSTFDNTTFESILPLHAITGCVTVSFFAGIGKKSAWKIFKTDCHLLVNLGVGELTDQTSTDAEKFVCKLYDVATAMTSNDARVKLFCKGKTPQALPPTSDALNLHIKRAHYQTRVWRESVLAKPALPSPVTAGWILDQGQFRPELMSLTPIPQSCTEIVSCGCNEGCSSKKCSCRKGKLICMAACKNTENLTKICMNKFECVK